MSCAPPIAPDRGWRVGSTHASGGLCEEAARSLPTPIARPPQALCEDPCPRDEEGVGEGRSPEAPHHLPGGIEHHLRGDRAAEEAAEALEVVAHRDQQDDEPIVAPRAIEQRGQLTAARRAPGGPELHEDDMTTQRLERHRGAIQTHKAHVRCRLHRPEGRDVEVARSLLLRGRAGTPGQEENALQQERTDDREAVASRDPADVLAGRARHDGGGVVARATRSRNPGPSAVVRAVLALIALALLTAACTRKAPEGTPAPSATPAQTFKGGPAAHPGDWCGGHGVPESECTRCNPALIPQFQARHDWCGEHGLPESQCPICHPEHLREGVAPPRPGDGRPAGESPPAHGEREAPTSDAGASGVRPGTTVRLARPAVAERVGIQTVEAEVRALADEVAAPVRLDFDPARLARVSARVPGVVRTIPAELGAVVRAGDLLLTLDSAVAAATRADLTAAATRTANAEVALRRAREVRAAGLGLPSDLEGAETAAAAARAELASLRATSAMTGAGGGRLVRVLAPRAGVVVRRSASVGQQVTAEEVLIEVADPSRMWAILDVLDADAPRLAVGQSVTIAMDGVAAPFQAPLAWLSPVVDPHTRTVQARVELPNADGRLRANAFGRARVAVGSSQAGVVVPRDALQRVGEEEVVFVARAPLAYEARVVTVAVRAAREVQLTAGVTAGERVVTTGGFALKTELLRDSIGAGCCDEG
jgi:cobalt-zinc-cadmium efflux system membrane fusion protein